MKREKVEKLFLIHIMIWVLKLKYLSCGWMKLLDENRACLTVIISAWIFLCNSKELSWMTNVQVKGQLGEKSWHAMLNDILASWDQCFIYHYQIAIINAYLETKKRDKLVTLAFNYFWKKDFSLMPVLSW